MAACGLIGAAYLGLEPVRIELHFLLSQLNHGVSSGKILFLLGFVAAVMLRVALSTDGVDTSLLYRRSEDEPFEVVATTSFRERITPLFFTFDNKELYVSSNVDRDRRAIYRFDPETGRHGELIFEHPDVDVASLIRSRRRQVVTGATFVTDRRGYEFFDGERRRIQRLISQTSNSKTPVRPT